LGFQLQAAVAITAVNQAELLHGMARLPEGQRKQDLQQSWEGLVGELFAERVWPFTSEAAHWYAEVLCRREQLARPMERHWQSGTAPTFRALD